MNKSMMRKVLVGFAITGLMLILAVGAAFAWEAATHAYIEQNLYKKTGHADDDVLHNRIYGANAIDIFNNIFTSPFLDFAAYFHSTSQETFLQAWQSATSVNERAFAYGFVSHNNKWGMDSTAHISGITYGRGTGYVIAKARVLAVALRPLLPPPLNGLPEEVLVNLCHYLVESGVDFLVLGKDPAIGSKLMNAAYFRSDEAPELLARAYKDDFALLAGTTEAAAESAITSAEAYFRGYMMAYGYALTQPNALDLVAGGLADVGLTYLNLDPSWKPLLMQVAKQGITAAMLLCQPDFERELQATRGWVNGKLSSAGVAW
jgi:hypothetical protein